MSLPRRHHYLPKAYIAAWTDSGDASGQLCVLDKAAASGWKCRPVNAAVERDLYLIDLDEVEGDVSAAEIETAFAGIEGRAISVLRDLAPGVVHPSTDGFEDLLEFVASLALRVPRRLDWINSVLKQPVEAVVRRLMNEDAERGGSDGETAKKLMDMLNAGAIDIQIKKNASLAMMVDGMRTVFDQLKLRTWTVLEVQGGGGDLVCCDQPVLLCWIKKPGPADSLGFGITNTAVFVPIGPDRALLGLFDATPASTTLEAAQVQRWNGELLGATGRFVIYRDDFAALARDGAVDRPDDVLARWRESLRG